MSDELKPLSKKHQRVLDEYLVCFKQWEAYQRVYPDTKYEAAKASATRLFTDANFAAHLQARLDEAELSAREALKLNSDIARGDISEFLSPMGIIDVDKLKNGKGRLVKKFKQRTVTKIGKKEDDEDVEITDIELELYPADSAIDRALKVHGKYLERVDLSNSDGTLKPEKEADDTRSEILRKLASIATATGADKLPEQPESE